MNNKSRQNFLTNDDCRMIARKIREIDVFHVVKVDKKTSEGCFNLPNAESACIADRQPAEQESPPLRPKDLASVWIKPSFHIVQDKRQRKCF